MPGLTETCSVVANLSLHISGAIKKELHAQLGKCLRCNVCAKEE